MPTYQNSTPPYALSSGDVGFSRPSNDATESLGSCRRASTRHQSHRKGKYDFPAARSDDARFLRPESQRFLR
jgi:hypothetical protein